jgi:hypothetical protein
MRMWGMGVAPDASLDLSAQVDGATLYVSKALREERHQVPAGQISSPSPVWRLCRMTA